MTLDERVGEIEYFNKAQYPYSLFINNLEKFMGALDIYWNISDDEKKKVGVYKSFYERVNTEGGRVNVSEAPENAYSAGKTLCKVISVFNQEFLRAMSDCYKAARNGILLSEKVKENKKILILQMTKKEMRDTLKDSNLLNNGLLTYRMGDSLIYRMIKKKLLRKDLIKQEQSFDQFAYNRFALYTNLLRFVEQYFINPLNLRRDEDPPILIQGYQQTLF